MPAPGSTYLQVRGGLFELALYLAFHPDAEVSPAGASEWDGGYTAHAAQAMLTKLVRLGYARSVEYGIYGPGVELARIVRTLQQPMAAPKRRAAKPAARESVAVAGRAEA